MVTNDQLLGYYEGMLRIVLWEQGLLRMIDEGRVSGFYHSGRGHEAVAVGACAALRQDDYLMYAHRGCGEIIAKGVAMSRMYGDFLANVEGTTKGLGAGIVHIAAPEFGVLGQSGTLGGCFPIAAGAAMSAVYRGTDQVALCFFGDGTSNRGTFHESANAAGAWKLPVIWLCQNNGWAVSVNQSESTAVTDLTTRAAGYGMPGISIDGNDVVAVFEAVTEAVARARSGHGPTFIEAKVQRFRGHFEGDPQTYRAEGELDCARENDPVPALASKLVDFGIADEGLLEKIRAKVQAECDEAARIALSAPMPSPDRLYDGLYA